MAQPIVAIVGSFTDSLPYELQKFLNTKADWIAYGFMLCTLLVIIALLRIKEYSSNKKYMIGLTLLIVSSAISLIDDVVAIPYAIRLPLNILKVIIPFVGLIMILWILFDDKLKKLYWKICDWINTPIK